MHHRDFIRNILFLLLVVNFLLILTLPSVAQDSEDIRAGQSVEGQTTDEDTEEVTISEDVTPIGTVNEITISGELVTSRGAVLDQMTFDPGDEISLQDIDLCRANLLRLNGIYWDAIITHEIIESDDGPLVNLNIELFARRTWFLSPTQSGGTIGDRNFLGTADMLSLAAYLSDDDYFYSLAWTDPQFMGGHNTMTVSGHMLDSNHSIRLDDIYSTGESYLIDRTGFRLNYRTTFNRDIGVNLGFTWEDVDTVKAADPFSALGNDNYFYYSGSDITPGTVAYFSLALGGGYLNSNFFPTEGYYWNLSNDIAGEFTFSDFDFTRHTLTAAYFHELWNERNVLCGRFMYSYLTGDPPNYELIPFDWQVRGYTGGTHRGKSLLAMNFEYRFVANPGIFDGVLFLDMGRSWDDQSFGFDGLEIGYGAGIRLYTQEFIPYNLLMRIDYGFSEYGDEAIIGFNHFF